MRREYKVLKCIAQDTMLAAFSVLSCTDYTERERLNFGKVAKVLCVPFEFWYEWAYADRMPLSAELRRLARAQWLRL